MRKKLLLRFKHNTCYAWHQSIIVYLVSISRMSLCVPLPQWAHHHQNQHRPTPRHRTKLKKPGATEPRKSKRNNDLFNQGCHKKLKCVTNTYLFQTKVRILNWFTNILNYSKVWIIQWYKLDQEYCIDLSMKENGFSDKSRKNYAKTIREISYKYLESMLHPQAVSLVTFTKPGRFHTS